MEVVPNEVHFHPSLPSEIVIESGSSESEDLSTIFDSVYFSDLIFVQFSRNLLNNLIVGKRRSQQGGKNSGNETSLTSVQTLRKLIRRIVGRPQFPIFGASRTLGYNFLF